MAHGVVKPPPFAITTDSWALNKALEEKQAAGDRGQDAFSDLLIWEHIEAYNNGPRDESYRDWCVRCHIDAAIVPWERSRVEALAPLFMKPRLGLQLVQPWDAPSFAKRMTLRLRRLDGNPELGGLEAYTLTGSSDGYIFVKPQDFVLTSNLASRLRALSR